LLRRAGFGASNAQVATLAAQPWDTTVDQLLDFTSAPADVEPAFLTDADKADWEKEYLLQQWWLDRMATSPTPLQEKLTLFWHGHFATANYKVTDMLLMYRQNALFRASAAGNFRDLVQAMSLQPAMLLWLDNDSNVAGEPNENFARELMELFTLGVNEYSQADVVASARAWTGYNTLDDDHERVSRSIESFLGGADAVGATAASSPEAAPGTAASSRDAAPGIATTVALVVVDGLPDAAALDRPAPIDETATEPSPDTAEVADALAMVERTLRGAARGSDVITTRGLGAFRIVLPSTGEHAAHAYLRRVRATIEPRLHAAERPLRLAVATATALDEPLEDVVRRAEGRLATALDAVRSPAPRARGPRDGGEPSGSDVDQVADQSPQLDDRATRALAAGADVD
jgi:hypothetical protein